MSVQGSIAAALRTRLDGYVRYAELIEAQLRAVDRHDDARLRELGLERERLAAAIDALGSAWPAPAPAAGERDAELERVASEIHRVLARAAAADRELLHRLDAARSRMRAEIRDATGRETARGYLHDGATGAVVDVRL